MPKSPPLYYTRTVDTGSGVQYNSGHEKNEFQHVLQASSCHILLTRGGGWAATIACLS